MGTLSSKFEWVKASQIRLVRADRAPDIRAVRALARELVTGTDGAFYREALPVVERACWQPYRAALFAIARELKPMLARHRLLTDRTVIQALLVYVRKLWRDEPAMVDLVTDLGDCMRVAGRKASALERAANQVANSATWPDVADDPRVNHLAALMRALAAVSPTGTFFMACRTAEAVCGFRSHTRAAEAIRLLIQLGWVAKTGTRSRGRAQEYVITGTQN
jgi:hypothetical protein